MATTPLDSDITAATTDIALRKIEAQAYRNALADNVAFHAASLVNELDALSIARAQNASRPLELTMREKVTLAIAEKYMTTSTSTVPATVLADAQADAARLKAAVDEVLKTLL